MTPQQILEKIRTDKIILSEADSALDYLTTFHSPARNLIDPNGLASILSDLINRIEKLEDRMNGVIRPDGSGSIAFVEEKKDDN